MSQITESILIIDDNEDILLFLSEIFRDLYRIYSALNGDEALKILSGNVVSLIISDVMMPGIDGFELCDRIKGDINFCHIPIILLTAKNGHKAQIDGLEAGADAYIKKPFSPKFLRLQIENLLKNRLKIKKHFATSPFEDVRVIAHSKVDEQFLRKLDDYICKNLRSNDLDVDHLAAEMFMSRTTFYRKVKSLSSLSPKELVDLRRLKKAAELIALKSYSMAEVAGMVGYNSQAIFTVNFQKHFHTSPTEYRGTIK